MDSFDNHVEVFHLDAECELRFGIFFPEQEIILEILEGSAEIYGSQLRPGDVFKFSYFCSVAVFSTSGCVLKLKSSQKLKYELTRPEELSIVRRYNDYLQSFRGIRNNDKQISRCPVTLITGPTDVGKSTLCRQLLNNAARLGRKPLFIDLDVGQSTICIPGTFGILPIKEQCNAYGKFDERFLSVYFFGYKSPGHNMTLYERLVHKVGQALDGRLNFELGTEFSEVIIDTCGWISGGGYNLILEIIQSLNVNTVLAIGADSHYEKLRYDLASRIELWRISKLDGVSVRNKTIRINTRDSCLHEYFYGLSRSLNPHRFQMQFSDIKAYKYKANQCSKKFSNESSFIESDIVLVQIEPCILNQVFGVSYADRVQDILLSSVYGFICFIDIDMELETITVLSPQPAPLPSKYLLMGDIIFNYSDFK